MRKQLKFKVETGDSNYVAPGEYFIKFSEDGTTPVSLQRRNDDLTMETILLSQVQSDWNESDNTEPSYIQNKPCVAPIFELRDDKIISENDYQKIQQSVAIKYNGIFYYRSVMIIPEIFTLIKNEVDQDQATLEDLESAFIGYSTFVDGALDSFNSLVPVKASHGGHVFYYVLDLQQ